LLIALQSLGAAVDALPGVEQLFAVQEQLLNLLQYNVI